WASVSARAPRALPTSRRPAAAASAATHPPSLPAALPISASHRALRPQPLQWASHCQPGGLLPGTNRMVSTVSPKAEPSSPSRLRSEEHTSELQSRENLVCRLLLEKKKLGHGIAQGDCGLP